MRKKQRSQSKHPSKMKIMNYSLILLKFTITNQTDDSRNISSFLSSLLKKYQILSATSVPAQFFVLATFKDLADTDKQKLQIILKNYTESQKMINTLKSQLEQQQQQHKNEVSQLKEELRELSEMSRMSRASSQRSTQIKKPQTKQNIQNQTSKPVPKPIKTPQKHTQQNKQQESQLASSNTFALSNDPVRNLRILQNQVANTFQNMQNDMQTNISQISTIEQKSNIPNVINDNLYQQFSNQPTSYTQNNIQMPGDVAFGSGSPVSQYLQTDTIRQLSGQGNIVDIINQSLPKFNSESFICNHNNNYMTQQEMDQRINEIIQQQQENQYKDPPYMNLLKSKQEFNMRMQQKFNTDQSPHLQQQNNAQTDQNYTQLNTAQLNNRDEKDEIAVAKTAINLAGTQQELQSSNQNTTHQITQQQSLQLKTNVEQNLNVQEHHILNTGYSNSALPVVSALDEKTKRNQSDFVQLNHNLSQPKVISVAKTHTPPPEDIPISSAKPTTQLISEQKRKQMEKSVTMMEEKSDDLPINSAILGKNNVTMNTSTVTNSRVSHQSMQSHQPQLPQQSQQYSRISQNTDLDIDKDFYNEYRYNQQIKQQKELQKTQQIQQQYQQLFQKSPNQSVRATSSVNRTRSSDYPRVDLSQNNYYNQKDKTFDSYENQETFPASATAEPVNDLIDKKLIDSQRLKVSEARLFDSQRVKMDENLKIYDKQEQSIRKTIGCLDEDEYESIIQLLQSSYGG